MFPSRYFNPRYWAARYWPKIGGIPTDTPDSFYASSGVINANMLSSVGMIDADGLASESLITDSFSSSGKINDNTISSTGIIDPDGLASKGDI